MFSVVCCLLSPVFWLDVRRLLHGQRSRTARPQLRGDRWTAELWLEIWCATWSMLLVAPTRHRRVHSFALVFPSFVSLVTCFSSFFIERVISVHGKIHRSMHTIFLVSSNGCSQDHASFGTSTTQVWFVVCVLVLGSRTRQKVRVRRGEALPCAGAWLFRFFSSGPLRTCANPFIRTCPGSVWCTQLLSSFGCGENRL